MDGQAAGRLRTDVEAEAIGRFLRVILDGVVVQRALGLETPDAELLLRFTRDAIAAREGTAFVRSGPSGPHRRIADYEPIPSSSAYARS